MNKDCAAFLSRILHYTDPGDIVFDGFCGTGMTGVAAQACGVKDSLVEQSFLSEIPKAKWGTRKAVLSDLAPAATSISKGYNTCYDMPAFHEKMQRIVSECKKECGWMYKTRHVPSAPTLFDDQFGDINYIVWSDVLICPNCGNELVYWDAALNQEAKLLSDPFTCPHCSAKNGKNSCKRAKEPYYSVNGSVEERAKQVPVLIVYTANGKRYQKVPDRYDFDLIKKIEDTPIPYWFPTDYT